MHETFKIRISHASLAFSGAHFITFEDGQCETLHGHDYRVAVELEGDLNAAGYVWDFVALRQQVQIVLQTLDHRVLIPTKHPALAVEVEPREVTVRWGDRRWVFPAAECALVPVVNTTAELLAAHLARVLLDSYPTLRGGGGAGAPVVRGLSVEVQESEGHSATCRQAL